MVNDMEFHMWKYWRDDKGLEEALTEYYPNTLKGNVEVANAYAKIKAARRVIDAAMAELAEDEERPCTDSE
jgi:hypothetical protein